MTKFEHHTSGGRYDPAEEFSYFLATGPTRATEAEEALGSENVHPYMNILVAVNELDSPRLLDHVERLLDDDGRRVLLDSGIFNLTMMHARSHGMTMDEALTMAPDEVDGFSELYDRYCEIAVKFSDRVWGMIELDLGGAEVKPETRARIMRDTGIVPIPVVHPLLDGWEYYDNTAESFDRICVGNLVKAVGAARTQLIHGISERQRTKHPDTWHHLLGVTPSQLTSAVPVYGSCDSSSWLAGARWPQGWGSTSSGAAIARRGAEFYYRSRLEAEVTGLPVNYYNVDAISLQSSYALQENMRAIQRDFEAPQSRRDG